MFPVSTGFKYGGQTRVSVHLLNFDSHYFIEKRSVNRLESCPYGKFSELAYDKNGTARAGSTLRVI